MVTEIPIALTSLSKVCKRLKQLDRASACYGSCAVSCQWIASGTPVHRRTARSRSVCCLADELHLNESREIEVAARRSYIYNAVVAGVIEQPAL